MNDLSPTEPNDAPEANPNTGIGGNNPPEPIAYDEAKHTEFAGKVNAFVGMSDRWVKTEITSEQLAEQLTDQIAGLRKLYKSIDKQRADDKRPWLDAGEAVQTAYKPLLDRVDAAGKKLKSHLSVYAAKKQREAEEEQRRQREEARKAEEAARLKAMEAEQSGSIDDQVEAEEAAKAAAKQAKAAAKPVSASIKSASGAGRTISTRTVKTAKIINQRQLFLAIQDEPEVLDVLQRVANRIIRAKGFGGTLNGVEIVETKSVA